MKSRIKFEAVATIGKYKDKITGEERKNFLRCGTVFEAEDGRLSLKLDAVPCSPEWSGFISFYPPKEEKERVLPPDRRQSRGMPPAPEPENHEDDDLPF